MSNIFSSNDLRLIARRTNQNNHSENRLFVAKKVGALKQAKIIEATIKSMDKIGYLDSDTNVIQQKAWDEVKIIAEKKLSSAEWDNVYSRM